MIDIQITINLRITNQDINDILCTAFEGGITYWCNEVNVVNKDYNGYASDALSKGYPIELYDAEDDKKYLLTKDKFIEGLKKYIPANTEICMNANGEVWEIDTSNIDAGDADCIIQYALFGDVVYG